jgi:two-component system response regulator GlrR
MSELRHRVLIVDDDDRVREEVARHLEPEGCEVVTADTVDAALMHDNGSAVDLVITEFAPGDGLAVVDTVQRANPTVPVIVLTGHDSVADAVEATRRGVFAYLIKPCEPGALLDSVRSALAWTSAGIGDRADGEWRGAIITQSPVMEDALRRAKLIAATDVRVLIQGASGTGKELLAQAIHRASARRDGPFVPVNCAAIPEGLLESELFGHSRGAFTGATRDRTGLFQAAHRGTLFLDEIGDIPLALQAKLLRVIEEEAVRPLGQTQPVPVDIRLVSATNRDLRAEAEAGRFRDDLHFRLAGATLTLPSLTERCEDIPLLAAHILARVKQRYGVPATSFSPDALAALMAAPWPGNVRQLASIVEQVAALCPTPVIPGTSMQEILGTRDEEAFSLDLALQRFEREFVTRLLRATSGNVSRAAAIARRNRTNFYRLLRRHRIDPADFALQRSAAGLSHPGTPRESPSRQSGRSNARAIG